MARPRKLNATKTGNHTKSELEESKLLENGLEQFESININSEPADLTENAVTEWRRVVPLLEQLPIANLDYTMIKRYCQLVDINDDAYADVIQNGAVNEENTKKTGSFLVYMDTLKEIKSICGQLGMTIDSRMRIVVPTEKENKKSIFDEFALDEDDDEDDL
ncbi:phage terminase small subunit P27 family [Staphylococcus kloosii]|uniref:Phage terminase small subunit n=1 Tax=Staphylococcus kloosii TaxID=29384 RepID=A0ABQ0XJ02_9STAP|nr:phage terminase small subunit P27 family [Staphylococcus kloosii]AVQ36593.1 phage terminase small subunit P27 family [Staphylococcus kloosii]PNZ06368.1 phage terminase small subunit P27 family [Staphylococcus kloosii]GEP81416.1 phage terminase small subunit [Staphylococcus kloosii]SUM49686.1 phage terminase small subunit [Staphylococcus kloosii]